MYDEDYNYEDSFNFTVYLECDNDSNDSDCDNDEWLFDNMYKRIYPLVQNNIDFLMKPK